MSNKKPLPFVLKSMAAAVALTLGQLPGLAVGAANKEFRVNPAAQSVANQGGVAADSKGNFAAAWVDDAGLALRFYFPSGKPTGKSLMISGGESADGADLAMQADGQAVVVWGDGGSVSAQLFNANGSPKGTSIPVSAAAQTDIAPAVAMNGQGGFVVVWKDGSQVLAKTFDATGSPKPEIVVDDLGDTSGVTFSVAMDRQGDFVVAWVDDGIWFRRFDANGNALGETGEADTITDNDDVDATVSGASVAMDADGDFVVAWGQQESKYSSSTKTIKGKCTIQKYDGYTEKYCEDDTEVTTYTENDKASVRARRYSKSGAAIGGEVELTKSARQFSYTDENESADSRPSDQFSKIDIAMDSAGNFVVGWEFDKVRTIKGKCTQSKDEYGKAYTDCEPNSYATTSQIQARKYKASGKPNGAILLVAKDANKTPANNQPAVSLSDRGDVAVTWLRPTGDSANLFGRVYSKGK